MPSIAPIAPQPLPLVVDLVEAWAPTGGGIRSYVEAKARYFTENGLARHLLIVPGGADHWESESLRSTLTLRSPPIPGCAPYRLLLRHRPILDVLVRHRPAVLELGSTYVMDQIAHSAREELGIFVSSFCHTDVPVAYVEPVVRSLLGERAARFARRLAERRLGELHGRLDATLVASSRLLERLRAQGIPRLIHVPLGVELDRFSPAARTPELRAGLGLPGEDEEAGPRLFTFLGRLDEEKRVRLLLKAFEDVPPALAHLLLVGEGPLLDHVRARAGTSPHIHHLPYTRDRNEVARILASSDVYISAGPWETFGLSILEAQSAGRPVLGVASGALLERIDGTSGWLVPPDDAAILSGMIRRVAVLPRRRLEAMGRAARARAHGDGGWGATFRRLACLYGLDTPARSPAAVLSSYGEAL